MRNYCYVFTKQIDFKLTHKYLSQLLPEKEYETILIKPNWVLHEENSEFPISATVTSPSLVDIVIEHCLKKYPTAKNIIIGDAPLQSCEWDKLTIDAGIQKLVLKYKNHHNVFFLDFRKECFKKRNGYLIKCIKTTPNDPFGNIKIELSNSSFLESVSKNDANFAVQDYLRTKTRQYHRQGHHSYIITGSAIHADLIINLPKMKTHQKSGITGALKNIVGLIWDKTFLVHHREGKRGDEFPPDIPLLIPLQVHARNILQKRSQNLFVTAHFFWNIFKNLYATTHCKSKDAVSSNFYVGSGSWYGNDTIWRMIYDLNKILLYGIKEQCTLSHKPQRDYFSILDGIIAGEGNGPLLPRPVNSGVIIISDNPFIMDMAMARLMGFDTNKIKLTANFKLFHDLVWTDFDPDELRFNLNGDTVEGIYALPIIKSFIPPPGWKGHIEFVQ